MKTSVGMFLRATTPTKKFLRDLHQSMREFLQYTHQPNIGGRWCIYDSQPPNHQFWERVFMVKIELGLYGRVYSPLKLCEEYLENWEKGRKFPPFPLAKLTQLWLKVIYKMNSWDLIQGGQNIVVLWFPIVWGLISLFHSHSTKILTLPSILVKSM